MLNNNKIAFFLTAILIIITTLFSYTYVKFKHVQKSLNKSMEQVSLLDDRLYNDSFDSQPSVSYDNLMNEVTIIVPSFDKYSELWGPFFTFLFKHWPELLDKYSKIPVILVSNFEKYDENPRVENIKVGTDLSWSDNLITALHHVNTKYVLIILEDYIINAPVNSERIQDMLSLLETNRAAYVEIWKDDGMFECGFEKNRCHPNDRDDVIIRSKDADAEYRGSLQASIWNKKTLQKLLVPGESAWDFEVVGNDRTKRMPQNFYMIVKDSPISYLNAVNKRKYMKSVVDYINNQGVEFKPIKLPIKDDQ